CATKAIQVNNCACVTFANCNISISMKAGACGINFGTNTTIAAKGATGAISLCTTGAITTTASTLLKTACGNITLQGKSAIVGNVTSAKGLECLRATNG